MPVMVIPAWHDEHMANVAFCALLCQQAGDSSQCLSQITIGVIGKEDAGVRALQACPPSIIVKKAKLLQVWLTVMIDTHSMFNCQVWIRLDPKTGSFQLCFLALCTKVLPEVTSIQADGRCIVLRSTHIRLFSIPIKQPASNTYITARKISSFMAGKKEISSNS